MDLLATVKERTLLLDGAMGTELISRGFAPGGPPEEWNVSRPADVAAIHAAYYAAGSDIVADQHLRRLAPQARRLRRGRPRA